MPTASSFATNADTIVFISFYSRGFLQALVMTPLHVTDYTSISPPLSISHFSSYPISMDPRHIGMPPNDTLDQLAKEAALAVTSIHQSPPGSRPHP